MGGVLDSVLVNLSQPLEVGAIHNQGFILISSISNMAVRDGLGNGVEHKGVIINQGLLGPDYVFSDYKDKVKMRILLLLCLSIVKLILANVKALLVK